MASRSSHPDFHHRLLGLPKRISNDPFRVSYTGTFTIDFDPFAFTVPTGTQVSSINLEMADTFGDIIASTWRLRQGSTILNGGTLLESLVVNSTGSVSATTTPLQEGAYQLSHGNVSRAAGVDSGATYTFSITVIPEPSSLLALAGCGLLARKRRQRRECLPALPTPPPASPAA